MNPWFDGTFPTASDGKTSGGSVSDARLIAALEEVELWRGGGKLEARGGLDAAMDPDALSTGQRQLFNIARAVVRGGKVVVMDEVTSRYVCCECFLFSCHFEIASLHTDPVPPGQFLHHTSLPRSWKTFSNHSLPG